MGENDKGDEFNVRAFSRAKRRCPLIVRLKLIKCYEGLLCYLSFYIPPLAYSLSLSPLRL